MGKILGGILIVILVIIGGCTALIGGTVKSVSDENDRKVAVVYEVVPAGDVQDFEVTISYGDVYKWDVDGNTVSAPWSGEVMIDGVIKTTQFRVVNGPEGYPVTCRIWQGTDLLDERTMSGPGAEIFCQGTAV